MRAKLTEWSNALGFMSICDNKPLPCEIFPKRDLLQGGADDGNGSWLNLPYFAGIRTTRYALDPDDGAGRSLQQFLDLADARVVTEAELSAWPILPPAQGNTAPAKALQKNKKHTLRGDGTDDILPGGPPCLNCILREKVSEGSRNEVLFNLATYCRKASSDDTGQFDRERVIAQASELEKEYFEKPLDSREKQATIKSALKKNFRYRCKNEPLASHCNPSLCQTRQHGIGMPPTSHFVEHDGCIALTATDKDGNRTNVALSNFTARIIETIYLDDGVTSTKCFRIAGKLQHGKQFPTIDLPVREFTGRWWLNHWDANAIVEPLRGLSLIGAAIQELSRIGGEIPERHVYTHTGWRRIDGRWVYLHGGGAVGAEGRVDGIETRLSGSLAKFALEPVADIQRAVRASLRLFELGAPGIIALAAAYRAPLCEFAPVDFGVWFAGKTGLLKSAVFALAQGHFGRAFNYNSLPGG